MLCKIYFPNSKLGLAYNILIVCYKSKDFSGMVAPFFCQLGKVRGTVAPFLCSERVKLLNKVSYLLDLLDPVRLHLIGSSQGIRVVTSI